MCSICKTEIRRYEKFQIRKNPKPYKSGNILVHGLLTCKKCSGVWNRDVNGATNIYKIAKNAINGLERPKYLCRKKKEENLKVEKLIKERKLAKEAKNWALADSIRNKLLNSDIVIEDKADGSTTWKKKT